MTLPRPPPPPRYAPGSLALMSPWRSPMPFANYEARSQAGLAAALRALGEVERAAPLEAAATATAGELGMVRLERELAAPSAS